MSRALIGQKPMVRSTAVITPRRKYAIWCGMQPKEEGDHSGIELPGHAQAAISAYPELSCRCLPVEVANDWGVFKEIYCAGNDSVFLFLENVLLEVMELFPSTFIHIGGDEAPKTRWKACAKCQKRIGVRRIGR